MNGQETGSFHTVGEEWLASYVAGGLSPAKRLVIACQAWVQPDLKRKIDQLDHVGGALLEGAEGETLSEGFMTRVFAALDAPHAHRSTGTAPEPRDELASAPNWMPRPLRRFMRASNLRLAWRPAGSAVTRVPLWEGENGERLYLLRCRGGLHMPNHGHSGEEWTLILKGGYHVGEEGFAAGDLHQADNSSVHAPEIDPGETCICLVADEGKVRFTSLLARMLQPVIGV